MRRLLASSTFLGILLLCAGWPMVCAGPARAASGTAVATGTPVATTPTPAHQPAIGAALSYAPEPGTIDWTSSAGAPLPGGALQQVAATTADLAPGQQAALATATTVEATAQPARQPAQAPLRRASAAPTAQAIPARQATTVAPAHRTTGAQPAAKAQPLHLPAFAPIGVPSASSFDAGELVQLAGKFAVVLVLLFLCLRVLRAVMPRLQGGASGRHGALVLYSEAIGDKQRICVLDLQVKLALVSISSSGVTPITTIDDPEQIAALRAQYQAGPPPRRSAPVPSFASLLDREVGATPTQLGTQTAIAAALSVQERARRTQGPAPGTPDGEPLFGQAMATLRSLRQKVEQ